MLLHAFRIWSQRTFWSHIHIQIILLYSMLMFLPIIKFKLFSLCVVAQFGINKVPLLSHLISIFFCIRSD